ncbi:hypothetical protein [Paenibacillus sp. CF384]|uniref:hypothetical protein n=1 Tax=Paenibacillus sp. CF384 TaxID=1884382 RepID=UPI00089A9E94|nr:hypothetical protein [Paenibacillus sp. CF384]SDX70711.1 hypothetical protein SAMN05518855_101942 [Paenibacillus sp. CF384]
MTNKIVPIAIIGVLLWIGGAILGGLYYFNKIADPDNFYADPSPVPLFLYTLISGIGLIVAIFSVIVYVTSLRKR